MRAIAKSNRCSTTIFTGITALLFSTKNDINQHIWLSCLIHQLQMAGSYGNVNLWSEGDLVRIPAAASGIAFALCRHLPAA